jgi:hypothetical protein
MVQAARHLGEAAMSTQTTHTARRLRANAMLLALLVLLIAMWLMPEGVAAAGLGVTAELGCEVRDGSWVQDGEKDFCQRALSRHGSPHRQDFFQYWNEAARCGGPVVGGPAPALVLSFRLGGPAKNSHRDLTGWLGVAGANAGRPF